MYIELTSLKDKNGQQCPIAINLKKVDGFEEKYANDFVGSVVKDKAGYPNTYTEVTTNRKVYHVAETVSEILKRILQRDV